VGRLDASETPTTSKARLGKVFERRIAPTNLFLEWLLRHPDQMHVSDDTNFNSSDAHAQEWRRKLFSTNTVERASAIAEGVKQLAERGAQHSGQEWWAFEGFTHIDCCLVTDTTVLFVEGKRAESVSPATHDSYPHLTDARRSELARHLMGFVIWAQIVEQFSLPAYCLPRTTANIHPS
jgi:hypothetical protein